MKNEGIHIVIAPSINRLDMHQYNTPLGQRYALSTMDYRFYQTLNEAVVAASRDEIIQTIQMDYDEKSIMSPFFETEEAALVWGLQNFPHLSKVELIDVKKGEPWSASLLSAKAIKGLWLAYARTGLSHPATAKPEWVDALRAENADENSGGFI